VQVPGSTERKIERAVANGGKRPGAGRPKGAKTKASKKPAVQGAVQVGVGTFDYGKITTIGGSVLSPEGSRNGPEIRSANVGQKTAFGGGNQKCRRIKAFDPYASSMGSGFFPSEKEQRAFGDVGSFFSQKQDAAPKSAYLEVSTAPDASRQSATDLDLKDPFAAYYEGSPPDDPARMAVDVVCPANPYRPGINGIPWYPSVTAHRDPKTFLRDLPDVTIPAPAILNPADLESVEGRAKALQRAEVALSAAIASDAGRDTPRWARRLTAQERTLAAAFLARLAEVGASPETWCAFSADQWHAVGAQSRHKAKPLPASYAFSISRLEKHLKWFLAVAPKYCPRREIRTRTELESMRVHARMLHELLARRPTTLSGIREIVDRHLPPERLRKLILRIRAEVVADQKRIDEMVARGEWLWDRGAAPRGDVKRHAAETINLGEVWHR
jgi:hypothetical protein